MSENRRGRPATEEPRENIRKLRLTQDEARDLDDAARRDGTPVARWIRERALEAARRER